eukprot:gene25275-10928_t
MACSVNVTVYYQPCSDSTCRGRLLYDGQHDAVFNYSGRSLFTYECMNAFWDETVDSYKTFHGHHADMKRNHERSGVLSMLPCLNVVRPALWRYLDLLDIDYADFGCPCCSHLSADELCLVMDGITMGMRKDLATLLPFQALQQPEVPDFPLADVASIKDSNCRKLLKKYCGLRVSTHGAQEERWDADTWMELLSECEVREPIVFKFLKFVELTTPSPLPGPFKAVLTAICTDYPISGLLDHHCVASDDPERTPLMQAVRGSLLDSSTQDYLRNHFPVLLNLAKACRWNCIPVEVQHLVLHLQEKAKKARPERGVEIQLPVFEYESTTVHASQNLSACRNPHQYKADRDRKAKAGQGRDEDRCTKFSLSHPALSPGLFALFCPHGFCLMFKIMTRSEGPKTAFDLLYHRCHFLLDRMHQWGHVTCHAGYSFKNMEQDMELVPAWSNPNTGTSFSAVTIRTFNSQAAEQCNGKLKSIRTQVAYMRQDNYLKYVRYFLHKKNRAILKAATK